MPVILILKKYQTPEIKFRANGLYRYKAFFLAMSGVIMIANSIMTPAEQQLTLLSTLIQL